jgi:hypothetical protein
MSWQGSGRDESLLETLLNMFIYHVVRKALEKHLDCGITVKGQREKPPGVWMILC